MSRKNSDGINLQIKRLQNEDDARLCAQLMASSEPWITLRRTYENSLRMLRDPSKEVYVAKVNDEFVGFIVLIMSGALVGYVQTLGIKPEWRNQGIGSKMLEFAEEMIFKRAPNVFMCVSSFNEKAQRLYSRLGYAVIGELKDFIVPGHSEILLRKSIAPIREFKKKS